MSGPRELGPDDATDEVPAFLMRQQLPPPRSHDIERPSVLDVLRQCRPSRELLALLSRETLKALEAGNVNDGTALLALTLCVREVVT